ncbi:cysteine proteinase [Xylona heveae TC161]|uniref:Cysteine proteinase n=1 Tax=Xylona heveae (strain CBS 132557 / TC161) TaxID=1328760 RepID=A0A165GRK6_XYLHT|nr:cysteine proteinase [Xylona heveae TC161]KZF22507.1 cysteine proteinase [Xylona heveae TC161]
MSRHGGMHMSGASSSGSYDSGRRTDGTSPSSGRRPYPHVKDLVTRAVTDVNSYAPLPKLLRTAELSAKQADNLLNLERSHPDLAFAEYVRASHIISEVIPYHKDAPSLHSGQVGGSSDWAALWRLNRELIKKIDAQHTEFDAVRNIIIDDNISSGVKPTLPSVASSPSSRTVSRPSSRPQSVHGYYLNGDGAVSNSDGRASSLLQRQSIGAAAELRSGRVTPTTLSGSAMASTPPRRSPFQHEGPESLLRRSPGQNIPPPATSPAKSSTDGLAERFARLRTASSGGGPSLNGLPRKLVPGSAIAPEIPNGAPTPIVRMPSPSQFMTAPAPKYAPPSGSTTPSNDPARQSRLYGPRDPPVSHLVPPAPPKIPLNTQIPSTLPRAPSPTYSPARNLPAPSNINPPRTTARSMVSSGRRPDATALSGTTSDVDQRFGHTPPGSIRNGSVGFDPGRVPKRKPVERNSLPITLEPAITAAELREYLKYFNVLLVDLRERDEFDEGHIFATSVICIEPTALRMNMSAEDLEQSLILSPESELSLFEIRDSFDLVVYYDQSTSSADFLKSAGGHNSQTDFLKAFYSSVTDFNYDSPLKRPPKLLLGGLEAWIDLVGPRALATSETSAPGAKNGRPISRVPMAGASSNLSPKRRRIRGYDPRNVEEQQYWLEKARKESYSYEPPELSVGEEGDGSEGGFSMVHSYEEFHRRYPEASDLQQSMSSPTPAPAPYQYHSASIPRPPSRPAPAVPRTSYSGVSERTLSSQSSRPPHASPGTAPPLYNSTGGPNTFRIKLPDSGLKNYGITCYMNATLQCLSATIPLSHWLLMDKFTSALQVRNAKGTRGVLPQYLANLLKCLWSGKGLDKSLYSFREFAIHENIQWGENRQQDAKEFLDFLLDLLHEDLNIHSNRHMLRPLRDSEEERRERLSIAVASKSEWSRYAHRNCSYLSSLFAGQHASRLRCKTCNRTSTTYEAFWSISVEIPRSGTSNLQDCLRSYFQEENLTGDAAWKCPHCKCAREATKRIVITRVPQLLVVHFKRFATSMNGSTHKVHTPIDFPLHGLNLEPFAIPPATPEECQKMVSFGFDQHPEADYATNPPFLYDAYAVLKHIGSSANSGHYIAAAKDTGRGCWRVYNDTEYKDIDPKKVKESDRLQNKEAYIVFYMRSSAR